MVSVKTLLAGRLAALATLVLLFSCDLTAQESEFKPFVGLGVGNLTFFGDVGQNNENFGALTSNIAYQLKLSNQISSEFDLSFEALFGTMAMNERGSLRNLNFQSEIRSGGIHLAYDFGHFLPENRTITPILNIGITGFEFLSKTDLFDEDGRRYFYWSDGRIMDREQFGSDAAMAEELSRDYSYETDLRELNLDGVGDYREVSFSIPVGIGAQFRISELFKADFGTRLYWTGTDLIDNVTADSQGNRAGTSANDKFLFTSVTLSYGLHKRTPKEERINGGLGEDFLAGTTDRADEDNDGVVDLIDKCPHTPEGERVSKNGCPLDGDNDGVPDYADDEMDSAKGAIVNRRGVTVTDDEFAKQYESFSNGQEINVIESSVQSADVPKPVFTPRTGRKYMVQVDGSQEGISQELANKLLSLPDVQTIEKGDTILYMVGDYGTLPDAVKRKLAMDGQGFAGSVMEAEDGVLRDASERASVMENVLEASTDGLPDFGALYRVQVGAFEKALSANIFGSLEDLIIIQGKDGLTRYFTGVYAERDSALRYKDILLEQGYNDAFLTVFDSGKRMNVPEVVEDMEDVDTYEELYSRPTPDGFNESRIAYRILLAESDGSLGIQQINQFLELGKVDQMEDKGKFYYLHRTFDTRNEANEKLEDIRKAGLESIKVVGQFNGLILNLDEIDEMLRN